MASDTPETVDKRLRASQDEEEEMILCSFDVTAEEAVALRALLYSIRATEQRLSKPAPCPRYRARKD